MGLGGLGEGTVGMDGGIELAHSPDILNRLDVQTIKNHKTVSAKKPQMGAKSEQADYNTEKHDDNRRSEVSQAESTKSAMICRICLDYDNAVVDHDDEAFNPMISPCNCSGTMGGIHLKCLRTWLERNKTLKAIKGHVVVKYKKINCELCK